MGKLINTIPGSRLLISSLPGSALRMLVESLGQALRCQQAFSKPCLVNLISKDTHLLFSIYFPKFYLLRLFKIPTCYEQVGISIKDQIQDRIHLFLAI